MDALNVELSGELTHIGLRPLVNFLSDLSKSGRLVVRDDRWTGAIALLDGRIVGANFAHEQGLEALDAIFFALQHGSFEFTSTADCEHNLEVQPQALAEHLDIVDREVQQLADVLTSLSAVPGRTDSIQEGEITLTRSSLALLLAVDGRRSVAEHAQQRGLVATLRAMKELIRLGLVDMQAPTPGFDAIPAPVHGTPTRTFRPAGNSNPKSMDAAALELQRVNRWRRA
jgi:Domain of unknown function (DUF4388)